MPGKLSRQQQIFLDEMLSHGNGTRAAKAAGYKFPNQAATKLKALPGVKTELEKRREESAAKLDMTRDELLAILAGLARTAEQPRDQVSAATLLARLQGWEAPKKVEHSGPDGSPISLQAVPATRAQAIDALRLAAATNPEVAAELKAVVDTQGEVVGDE